ncbi:hypothetical protein TRP8649_04750 [Pelagimonas phthalicica]|uniref:Uncharacterized protein n=1 Tax=Pelagimonas phthalicica TaxID=1037362 RepID=A0A238JLD9_9RHOB|nr:hypothetical protein [Pelagimonas phthalicica]TDS87050.1 hypothetical protein CLV87_4839 [Pelagimonas phthalicica]SMX30606.1 hypothetical protein TRP8649_04750 [Pelagimonas phthalicica]
MRNPEEELAFAKSMEAQYELIKVAFESGNEETFDQAILEVEQARSSLKKGILDMIQDD